MEPSYVIVTSYHHFHRKRCQNIELCYSTKKIDQIFLVSSWRNLYLHNCLFSCKTAFFPGHVSDIPETNWSSGVSMGLYQGHICTDKRQNTQYRQQGKKNSTLLSNLMRLFNPIPPSPSPTTGTPVSPRLLWNMCWAH